MAIAIRGTTPAVATSTYISVGRRINATLGVQP